MDLLHALRQDRVLISDGGMGTMLQERGQSPSKCPETMNLEDPDTVSGITREYLNAGAQLVETNSFGANRLILEKFSLGDRLVEINRSAVQIAKQAVDSSGIDALVFGSIGPVGVFLEPLGDLSEDKLRDVVAEQAQILHDSGVDGICVETMTDLREAEITLREVKALKLACIALMCYQPTPKGYFTMMGADIEKSVKTLEQCGADVIGAGCGTGCADMLKVAAEILSHTELPVAIHPNAGIPELRDGEVFYPESPEVFARTAKELASMGVKIIGGCCGTTPDHIEAIAKAVS